MTPSSMTPSINTASSRCHVTPPPPPPPGTATVPIPTAATMRELLTSRRHAPSELCPTSNGSVCRIACLPVARPVPPPKEPTKAQATHQHHPTSHTPHPMCLAHNMLNSQQHWAVMTTGPPHHPTRHSISPRPSDPLTRGACSPTCSRPALNYPDTTHQVTQIKSPNLP
jgi:hypothetical protein